MSNIDNDEITTWLIIMFLVGLLIGSFATYSCMIH